VGETKFSLCTSLSPTQLLLLTYSILKRNLAPKETYSGNQNKGKGGGKRKRGKEGKKKKKEGGENGTKPEPQTPATTPTNFSSKNTCLGLCLLGPGEKKKKEKKKEKKEYRKREIKRSARASRISHS